MHVNTVQIDGVRNVGVAAGSRHFGDAKNGGVGSFGPGYIGNGYVGWVKLEKRLQQRFAFLEGSSVDGVDNDRNLVVQSAFVYKAEEEQ